MKKLLFVFVLCLLCLGVISCNSKEAEETDEAATIVTIESDAGASFVLDENGNVTDVHADDENGEIVLAGEDYTGLSIEEAIKKYLETANACGYITDTAENIKATITSSLSEEKISLIKEKMNTAFDECSTELHITKATVEEGTKAILIALIKASGTELTDEELNALSMEELVKASQNVLEKQTYYASEKLQELYQQYQDLQLEEKIQEAYTKLVEEVEGTDVKAEFEKLVANLKAKYEENEGLSSAVDSLIASAKNALTASKKSLEEKKAELDALNEKLQAEIAENTEKYGETTAQVMSVGTKALVEAAKVAVEAADKVYQAAVTAYSNACAKWAADHDGEEITLKAVLDETKKNVDDFITAHPELKDKATELASSAKEAIEKSAKEISDEFKVKYQALVDQYNQELENKKAELMEAND